MRELEVKALKVFNTKTEEMTLDKPPGMKD